MSSLIASRDFQDYEMMVTTGVRYKAQNGTRRAPIEYCQHTQGADTTIRRLVHACTGRLEPAGAGNHEATLAVECEIVPKGRTVGPPGKRSERILVIEEQNPDASGRR